ncbi:hypothetical protein [Couchioplanes caeruleus]|uniref:hypothetical protein n=1 Tax=Couchioplanes caeruleus TaxID=56438 RepID=UPI000AFDBAFA
MAGAWWADWLFMLGMLAVGVALIVCAAAYAGHSLGLGRRWAGIAFVRRNRWLI